MLLPLHNNLMPVMLDPVSFLARLVALNMTEIGVVAASPERSVSLNVPEILVTMEN